MEFLYPNFLWALLAILIPIIIHLFYFKRFKKVYFSNTKFLKEIKEETTNKNKLKNILVLLSRILAVMFLVFAFAQPYLPVGDEVKKGSVGVSIFIDNSYSMESQSEDIPLIDKAKKKAIEIVNGYSEDAQFQILTNKLYGVEQKWVNRENAIERIEDVKLSPLVKKLNNISKRQKQSFESNSIDNRYIYWITDLQKHIFDLDTADIDKDIEYNIIALQPVRERNISIDSCYWDNPVPVLNQVNKLMVKITNNSDEDMSDIPLNVKYNGQVYPSGKIDVKKGTSKIEEIELRIKKTSWNEAEITINDYPVTFDDNYYVAFNVPQKINILNIRKSNRANQYLKTVFETSDIFNFNYQSIGQVDYSGIKKNKLIVLEDIQNISSGLKNTLVEAVSNGANLLVFPPKNADIKAYNEFLNSVNANIIKEYVNEKNEAGNLNQNEFVFSDVYKKLSSNITPVSVTGYFGFSKFQTKNSYHVIKFKNGNSFIDRYNYGKGNIYVCASPFDTEVNDLAKNPAIFIPMVFKMALLSNEKEKLGYFIGVDKKVELDNISSTDEGLVKIKGEGIEFIPKQLNINEGIRLGLGDEIQIPGIYKVMSKEKIVKEIAFNYDRTESELRYLKEDDIKSKMGDRINFYGENSDKVNFSELINSKQRGIEFWKWAIILALLFLAIEVLLLRFWKSK